MTFPKVNSSHLSRPQKGNSSFHQPLIFQGERWLLVSGSRALTTTHEQCSFHPGWLFGLGDYISLSYVGIKKSQYKDPYIHNGMPQNPLFHGCPTKNPCRKKTVGYQPIHQPSQPTHQPSKPIHFGDPCVPRGFLQIGDDDDVAELREGDELEVG